MPDFFSFTAFPSFNAFLQMGGYGLYVWTAFAITFISMGWVCVAAIIKHRRVIGDIQNKIAREVRLEKAKKMENTL